MYNNICSKIKVSAWIIACIGIIGSILVGSYFIFFGIGYDGVVFLIVMGSCILIAGSLVSWVVSLFMYGFAEILEHTEQIAKNAAKDNSFE